jgi:hypothetical protein
MRYVLVLFAALLLSACSSMGHWRDSSGSSSNSGSRDSGSSASSRNSSMGMGRMGMMRGNDGAMNAGYNYSTMPLQPGDTYFGN